MDGESDLPGWPRPGPNFEDFGGPAFAQALLDAAPVIVLVLDPQGRVVHYNGFMERLCKRPLASVRGCDWFEEFLVDEERDSIRALFRRTINGEPVHAHVNLVRVHDGEPRLIEWYGRTLHDSADEVSHIVSVGVDITQRVREANERAELAQRFALFANRVGEAFFMTDAARSRVLYLSPAFERITGVSRQQVYADVTNFVTRLHPADRDTFVNALGSPIPPEAQGQIEREYRLLRPGPDGEDELRWVWVRYSEVRLHDGEAPRVVGTITDITERKLAAAEVEELGRIFALFDGAVDEVFLLLNPTRDKVLYASESVERVFGVDRGTAYQDIQALFEYVHPDDRGQIAAAIGRSAPASGQSYEYRVLALDGSTRWVVSRIHTLCANSPMPGAIVSISMDITARHKTEEALRRLTEELEARVTERTHSLELERQRLRQVIDGMAVLVAILDPVGHVLQVNAKASTHVSTNLLPDVIGHRLDTIPELRYSDQTLADIHAAIAQAQRGLPARFDLEVQSPLGCSSITDTSLNPILDEQGRVLEIVATGIDVTDRRKTERRLRDSLAELEIKEARLAGAQRIADVGDWDWDIVTNALHWSDQIFRIVGREPSDNVTYDDFLASVHKDDREIVAAAVNHALASGEHYELEHRLVRPDGEIRIILENGEVTCDAQGQPIRMQGTAQDITKQKQVEAQLRASLDEKDALLHEIHHRVKNNLQVVASLLYLQGVNAGVELRAVLDECRARIRSMALIHEQLYLSGELSRIEMSDFLETLAAELTRVFVSDRAIRIHVTGGGLRLGIERAVPVALLANELLTNALKYAYPNPEPGAEAKVRVSVSADSLEIADDGVGLPEGLDPSRSSSLGLRLVHSLARQLDARLEFIRNGGTRVRVELPTRDHDRCDSPQP